MTSEGEQSPLDIQPTNQNYIYPTNFFFNINRLPTMTYFTTKVNLPDFGFSDALEQPTRFVPVKHPATRVTFGTLEVSFLVDEDMKNWIEIQNWIKSLSLTEDHSDYEGNVLHHYSNATLLITNSAMNPNIEVSFSNIFPISITGLNFDSSITELTPFESTAVFAFDYYDIKKL